jgi:TolA-binding protein
MTTNCDEVMGSRALAALTRLGHDGAQCPTPDQLDQGLDALHARIATGRVRQRRMVRWSLAGAAMLMSVLVVVQIAGFSRRSASAAAPPTLTYQVEGGSVLEGGYLRASGDAGVKLAFNEGSEFVFTPGTRGRLRSVDEEGASVAIESGTAHFQVTPSDNWRWRVEVGPFLVTVKGTVFSVAWDPGRERFELRLRRGRVEVSGPVSDGSLALRGGQRLVVDLAKGETRITEDLPEQALDGGDDPANRSTAPRASGQASGSTAEPSGPNPASIGSAKAKQSKHDRRWAEELASGNWDRIIQDVERAGVGATLNSASSEELFALADAARYRRRTELAREALLAQRRRYPGSTRALFLLGRVEESHGGATAAVVWYDEYLARAPTGAYAAEALGRKMTITSKVGGPEKARPLAAEYLRRFPKGSYAGSARAILRVP